MDEVLDYNNIDVKEIFLKRTNRIFTRPYYFGKTIRILTPEMKCAFGIEKEYGKYIMKMRFNPTIEGHSELYDFIKRLEYFFYKSLKKNTFKSNIKTHYKYGPQLVLKVPSIKDNINLIIVDKKLRIPSDIVEGSTFRCEIEINTIWSNAVKGTYKWVVKKIYFDDCV